MKYTLGYKNGMIQVAIFICVEYQSTFEQLKLPAFIFGMFLYLQLEIGISNGLKSTSY